MIEMLIACWERNKPGKVVIVHDFASPGWEKRKEFNSFQEWYLFAITQSQQERNHTIGNLYMTAILRNDLEMKI